MAALPACASQKRPEAAMAEHVQSSPSAESRCTMGPAQNRSTNMIEDV